MENRKGKWHTIIYSFQTSYKSIILVVFEITYCNKKPPEIFRQGVVIWGEFLHL